MFQDTKYNLAHSRMGSILNSSFNKSEKYLALDFITITKTAMTPVEELK